ncbi:MAG: 30S ribosomal protein S2 [Candidatus Kapabacteria bacterium]|nr:30S ribosomal protein S2 [Candidatus Kapabacteria bacterium]
MEHSVSIEQLLESGAHFGHLTRRWNPKMAQFIFTERNGIHIIDLRKTQVLLDLARQAIYDITSRGRSVLFIGTKQQAKLAIEESANKAEINYVSERWLGGMLTNFTTIRKSIKRLNTIDKMETDGTFEKITKKERLLLGRERDRLRKVFGGIESMTKLPGALFVVDTKKEHLAIKEAKILGIPVIGIVDTNVDPEEVEYPIPANDDSIKTVELVAGILADAIIEGSRIAKVKMAELAADGERIDKETEVDTEDDPKVRRKLRERRPPARTGQATPRYNAPQKQASDAPAVNAPQKPASEAPVANANQSDAATTEN